MTSLDRFGPALSLLAAACLLAAAPVAAQDRSKYAVTDAARADEDFAFQGEYFGPVAADVWGCQNLGLQVIALGDGEFSAVLLPGGLPGAGWDRRTRIQLGGQRHDDLLTLKNEHYMIAVRPEQSQVFGARQGDAARLAKIRRVSFTLGLRPPPTAIVLFDGSSTEHFSGGKISRDGLLEVGPITRMPVRDFRLHLEFRTPYMPYARGQARGNSGVYIQQRYEVQILDSFGLAGQANECGGFYKQKPADVNMCLPPLSWQTYDIYFTAARFDEQGRKRVPARATVLHNGELIHVIHELAGKTGAGQQEGPDKRPILLQNHGNPVNFRNIWIVPGVPQSDLLLPGGVALAGDAARPPAPDRLLRPASPLTAGR